MEQLAKRENERRTKFGNKEGYPFPAMQDWFGAADRTGSEVGTLTGNRQYSTGECGQARRVIRFTIREQPRIRGDAGAMKSQLEAAVEREPKNVQIRFIRRVRHGRSRSDI